MRHAVAGLIDALPECAAIFAPHANSYRRLCPGSLAPTTATWGYENRTAALRIPGGPNGARRIEHRVSGADANPYLVIAAILAAALDGIEAAAEPPAPVVGNAYVQDARSLPSGWRNAVEAFAASPVVARLFPLEFAATFVACKRQEISVFDRDISDFEFATYLHKA
jgi:glutamine synthetase